MLLTAVSALVVWAFVNRDVIMSPSGAKSCFCIMRSFTAPLLNTVLYIVDC